jgi:peptidoglycan/LPS O-acetylase OafA/YrhL
VLRGLAAVYVMLSHYTSYCLDKFGSTPFHVVRETGEYAFWLFFMISGFVIFFTLERSRTVADFAVSRVSRLYPAYWATLTFGTLMEIFWFKKDVSWLTGYMANMTMFQEFFGIRTTTVCTGR